MPGIRLLLLLALGVAGAILVVLRLPTPRSPIAEPRSPPPVVESRKPPLQAEAEGYYVPGYPFTVNGFRFTRFSLRPEAETCESETIHCKGIARNIVPFGFRSEEHTSE